MKYLLFFFIFLPLWGYCGQNFSTNSTVKELYQSEIHSAELTTSGKLVTNNKIAIANPILIGLYIYLIACNIVRNICLMRIFWDWHIDEWKGLIPYYNNWVLAHDILKLKPIILVLGMMDVTATIFAVIMNIKLAKAYGRSALFGLGLLFLPIIFYPIIAYGRKR